MGKRPVPCSRRRALSYGGIATLLTLCGLSIASRNGLGSLKHPPSFKKWYGDNLANRVGQSCKRPTPFQDNVLSEFEYSSLEQAYVAAVRYNLGSVPTPITKSFRLVESYSPLNVSDSVFDQYVQRTRQTVDKFFEFLRHTKEKPFISWNLFNEKTVQYPSTERNLQFAVMGVIKKEWSGIYTFEHRGRQDSLQVKIESNKGGDINTSFGIDVKEEGLAFTHNPVYARLSASDGAIDAYLSPCIEALHFQLTPMRRKYMEEDIRAFWNKRVDKKIDFVKTREIINKWLVREESVVHALSHAFLEQHAAEEGFSQNEVQKYIIKGCAHFPHLLVPRATKQLETVLPSVFLSRYLHDTRAFCERIGL